MNPLMIFAVAFMAIFPYSCSNQTSGAVETTLTLSVQTSGECCAESNDMVVERANKLMPMHELNPLSVIVIGNEE